MLPAFFRSLVVALTFAAAQAADYSAAGFIEQNIGSGWNQPVGIAFHEGVPDHGYVWERTGKVWIIENGQKSAQPLIDISDEVGAWRDYGLLGLALHPNFSQNGYIYLFYVVDRYHLLNAGQPNYDPGANDYLKATIGRITRYTVRASDGFHSIDPASRKVLVGETISTGFPILYQSHGTGQLAFGADGTLLASCGESASYEYNLDEGGPASVTNSSAGVADGIIRPNEDCGTFRAQLVDSLSGKIVRLDPETGNGVPSNPFYDAANPRAARSRVWTLGLRNPFRICVRPETGSHDPADANPGVIVVGDVGWDARESYFVIDGPRQNCGWPIYEGLEKSRYDTLDTPNKDAPNPLGGFFRFKDLLVEDTLGTPSWPNPSNPSQQVPASVPHFTHHRPIIDAGRQSDAILGPVRTPIFSGNNAAFVDIGAANSPITPPHTNGRQFLGLCAIGGVFYHGPDFPASYAGKYFFADFGDNWIRTMTFDANHRPTAIEDFAIHAEGPVFLTTHPTQGSIYYVAFTANAGAGAVRQIVYAPGGNRPPVAAASADVTVGTSPLAVHFSSGGSSDPDGQPLTYLWDFGDGTTSTQANPTKTFTATGTKKYQVWLTVKDAGGAEVTAKVDVFVNHSLPEVTIVSPVDGGKYPIDAEKNFALLRKVVEVPGHPTTTQWQVFLHHNTHEHPEVPVVAASTSVPISPIHSTEETFYFRIVCTVTDDLGATVTRQTQIFPNMTNVAPQIAWGASGVSVLASSSPQLFNSLGTISDADSTTFDFGSLSATIQNGVAGDAVGIVPEGNGTGQVNVSGTDVLYEGVTTGTFATNNAQLTVTFNSVATPAAAQAIFRRLGAACQEAQLGTPRTIVVQIADGDGGTAQTDGLPLNALPSVPPTVSLTAPAEGATYSAPASVALTADANDTDGSIAKVEFFNGSTLLGEATSAPFSFAWIDVPAGNYTLTARATDDVGSSTESAPVRIVVNHDSTLPAVWHAGDIGAVAAGGMSTYADGAYTLTASGAGITSLKDEFHFLSQPWTGDGEIIAHVASVEALSVKSFGGIMFRERMSTSSRFALLKVTAGQGAVFQYRSQNTLPAGARAPLAVTAPRWLRLVRHGLRCTAYTSTDGVQWQQLGTAALPMAKALNVGLVASSALDGQTAQAVFDHVTVRSLTSPAPPTVTITSPAHGAAFTTPVTVAIDARASDPDGGIARVELFSGTKKLAIDTLAPFAFAWPGVKAGSYSLTARAFDFAGLKTTSIPVTINVATAASTLTAPWASLDMGATRQPGAATENAGATTLMSLGLGLGAKSDQGRFVYRQINGDSTVIARLASLADTAPGAHAGISFRETLGATARNVTLVVTNEQGAALRSRATVGTASSILAKPGIAAPQWLKLVRRKAVISAFVSTDGTTWTSVGKRSVAMAAKGYVALFVGAADLTEEATAVFDNISVTRP